MKIGIPRALLYYRYEQLWKTFFKDLGHEVIVSLPTNKDVMDAGNRYAIDENCLSSKLFFGHISTLIGQCDAIFVPRIANYGDEGVLCSRFEALYDMSVNTFRESGLRFLTCNIDEQQKCPEEAAYIDLGIQLGSTRAEAAKAYHHAMEVWAEASRTYCEAQQAVLDTDRIKILVVAHAYNLHDEYIGKPIIKNIRQLDAVPVLSDAVELSKARRAGTAIAEYVPWIMNKELLGAIQQYKDKVDGIVLITAFPCGPDSLVNEMIIRRVKDLPILNLLLDSQDGNAGIETRLESFIDIIRFRKEMHL